MTGVANLQRDLVDTVAQRHARGDVVGHEGVHVRGKDAVDGGGPFVRQHVIVKVP